MACDCKEYSRARADAPGRRAGRARPAGDRARACRCRPAPGSTGARSCCARAPRFSVYGASRLGLAGFQAGIASAQGSEPRPCSSRSSSTAAPTRSRSWRRSADSTATSSSGRPSRLSEGERRSSATTPTACAGIRKANKLHSCCDDADKVTVFPAIGYTDPDQSHFTSRHYWEVGALDPNCDTGWMGRLLDSSGPTTTRFRASRSTASSRRRSPPRPSPSPRSTGPSTTSGRRASGTTASPRDVQGSSRLGDAHAAAATSAAPGPAGSTDQAMRVREQLTPSVSTITPRRYPDAGFGRNLAGLAAMLDAGLTSAAPR